MTIKNLAYLALLAGWICFCYWLYAEGISPRLHRSSGKPAGMAEDSIPYPLAFRWKSDTLMTGAGFEKVKAEMDSLAMRNEVLMVRGFYFRDEGTDIRQLTDLGKRRIANTIRLLGISENRILTDVSPQEITADVKANPFEAIRFERILMSDLIKLSGDTIELCFPLRDSLAVPAVCMDQLVSWMSGPQENNTARLHIIGTADGSGIAEPMDIGMDRALWIKNAALAKGWKEEQIELSTGQRNHPLTLRNRCVVIFIE